MNKAQPLVGQTISLGGKQAYVIEWSEHHPQSLQANPGQTDSAFPPIQMDTDPNGWLKVRIATAASGSGQWWRYEILSRAMANQGTQAA